MPGEDTITMAQHELRRLHVIRKAIDKIITQKDASEVIGLSLRQAQRMVARVRLEGDKGVIHKARGRPSNRSIPDATRRKALSLFKATYHDFGPTLATEKLFERDKIKINDETFRLWLIEEGIPYKERKKRPHRQWRERKAHYGQMVQMDGSHHAWLEDRGPWCVFMGYIDDATGIPFGRFYTHEGTNPAMDSLKRYILRYGIPQSVYLDNHTTYKSPKKQSIEDELKNQVALSQFERAAKELSIDVIHADSPQAKGRVERLFKTFQDRLVKDLRLEGIKTIDEANMHLRRFLPKYAKRFAVKAREAGDLHRPGGGVLHLGHRAIGVHEQRRADVWPVDAGGGLGGHDGQPVHHLDGGGQDPGGDDPRDGLASLVGGREGGEEGPGGIGPSEQPKRHLGDRKSVV
jgi:transposase